MKAVRSSPGGLDQTKPQILYRDYPQPYGSGFSSDVKCEFRDSWTLTHSPDDESGHRNLRRSVRPARLFLPRSYWRLAILFYWVCDAGNLLLVIPTWASPSVISDGSGATWKVSQIINGCVLATVFTMDTFILLAWVRLRRLKEPLLEELTYLTTVEPPDSYPSAGGAE